MYTLKLTDLMTPTATVWRMSRTAISDPKEGSRRKTRRREAWWAPRWSWRRHQTWWTWGSPQWSCRYDDRTSPWSRRTCRQCGPCGNPRRGCNRCRSGRGGSTRWPERRNRQRPWVGCSWSHRRRNHGATPWRTRSWRWSRRCHLNIEVNN